MRIVVRPGKSALIAPAVIVGMLLAAASMVAGNAPFGAVAIGAAVALLTVAFLAQLQATIAVEGDSITVRYLGTSFQDQLSNFEPASTKKFDYRQDRRFGLKRLFRGIHLRGFCVGWFVLRDASVAFVCLSRKRRARALTTRDGYTLMLDPGIARRIERRLPAAN